MMNISNDNWVAMSDAALIKAIGAFTKHHRVAQNRTQQEVADSAGINRTTLSFLENGDIVNLSTLIQVLRALDLLYVMDVFKIQNQISPIKLAKLEQRKRHRASNKKDADQPKSDW